MGFGLKPPGGPRRPDADVLRALGMAPARQ